MSNVIYLGITGMYEDARVTAAFSDEEMCKEYCKVANGFVKKIVVDDDKIVNIMNNDPVGLYSAHWFIEDLRKPYVSESDNVVERGYIYMEYADDKQLSFYFGAETMAEASKIADSVVENHMRKLEAQDVRS